MPERASPDDRSFCIKTKHLLCIAPTWQSNKCNPERKDVIPVSVELCIVMVNACFYENKEHNIIHNQKQLLNMLPTGT